MIKQISVTFEFNPDTETVSNLKCIVDGIEKKKTRKKSEVVEELASEALATLDEKKLSFNNKAIADMGIEPGNRLDIVWESNKKTKTMTPTIVVSDEDGTGNKLTKSGTIAFKGKQNAVLADLGTEFRIEAYKEGVFKMVPTKASIVSVATLEEAIEDADEINADLITDEEDTLELDNLYSL